MGALTYILTIGILGSGLAFGFAMMMFDLGFEGTLRPWSHEVTKLVFLSLFFGLIHGLVSWDNAIHKKASPPIGRGK